MDSSDRRTAYRDATRALLAGDAEDALSRLDALPGADPERTLAVGKARLELKQGREAAECFRSLVEGALELTTSMRAYALLLLAAAVSLDGRREEAIELLERVPGLDARMEHAARTLRERIETDRTPIIRF